MNDRQAENEEKIFDAIQDLKDSIFGMKQPYIRFCYRRTEDGIEFDREKTAQFAAELTELSHHTLAYSEELEPVMPLFFEMCAMLLAAICGRGDWIFVSFRKIARTALKASPEEESTLERIVQSHKETIDFSFPDGSFFPLYDAFNSYMGHVESNDFYHTVKYTLENFVDSHRLNVLDRDRMTENVTARIHRLSAAIERDLNRGEESEEDEE